MRLVATSGRARPRRLAIARALLGLGAASLLNVGCSLWVSAELGDKPAEADGGQGGAGGGGGAATTGPTGATSTSTWTSTGSGAPVCMGSKADCDLVKANGCEVDLRSDRQHCGQCSQACAKGHDCKDGKCK